MNRVATKTQRGSKERNLMTRKRSSYQRGSVSLHNGVWTLRFRQFNHSTQQWTTKREQLGSFKDKKAAQRAAQPRMAEINQRNNMPARPRELTFEVFIATHWKAYTEQAKHEPSTLDLRDSLIRTHLLPTFGQKRLDRIEPTDIAKFFDARRRYTDSTLRALYSILHLLFDLAEQFDLIDKSPVRPKRHRPKLDRIPKPTLSAAQIRQVMANLKDEQERLLCLLLAVTGLRVREAMALCWQDFDAEGLTLAVRHTLYKGKIKKAKTEASSATVKLHPAVAAEIAAHAARSEFRNQRDFIFCQPDGRPLNYRTALVHLHRAIEACGIRREASKHGFHILRHSAGTLLYAKSRDLKLVQGTLRHAEISTTSDLYVHLDDKILSEGTGILTEEILPNGDLTVTKKRERAS